MSNIRNNKKNNKVKIKRKKRIKKTKIRINKDREIRNYNKIKK